MWGVLCLVHLPVLYLSSLLKETMVKDLDEERKKKKFGSVCKYRY
jgi:hypothetical protein